MAVFGRTLLLVVSVTLVVANAWKDTVEEEQQQQHDPSGIFDHEDYLQPEQIHLSIGEDESQMTVTWLTQSPTNHSIVEFGPKSDFGVVFTQRVVGHMTLYQDLGSKRRKLYIHRATLQNLQPGTVHYYHCGDPTWGWSAVYWFRALRNDTSFAPRFLIYGDLGNKNGRAVAMLQSEVQTGDVDAVLHVGDMGYDLADHNARVADEFFRQLEPISAYVPYQVCPGNHEYHHNFSNYNARFSMYNSQQRSINNHYHSFNVGPVHVVSISTEFYFFLQYGHLQLRHQYEWLIADLTEANQKANRAARPWIFLLGHRPMYCTNLDESDCTTSNSIARTGMPFTHAFALEPLLKKFGVDVYWSGHQHSYERLWPIFNVTVPDRSKDAYVNPQAPVHIVTGSPGCDEGLTTFGDDPQKISAYHNGENYTFSRVHVANKTHMILEQVAVPSGDVIDKITIEKDSLFPKWQQPDLPV